MRGLYQLFAAYGGFLLFVLLETISVTMIVQLNHRQGEIASNTWGSLLLMQIIPPTGSRTTWA